MNVSISNIRGVWIQTPGRTGHRLGGRAPSPVRSAANMKFYSNQVFTLENSVNFILYSLKYLFVFMYHVWIIYHGIKPMFLEDFFYLFKTFFGAVQVHSKIKRKERRFPIYFLPLHMHSLPHYQYPSPRWCICCN